MAELPRRYRFRPDRHLRTQKTISHVFAARCTASDARLIVHVAANGGLPMRLAAVVGRAYGGAVQRNRFRRLVREAFRLGQHEWPAGFDVIVRPKAGSGDPELDAFRESLGRLIPAAVARAKRRAVPETQT